MVGKWTPSLYLVLLLAAVGPGVLAGGGADAGDIDTAAIADEVKDSAQDLPQQDRFIIFDISSSRNLNKTDVSEAFRDLLVQYTFQVYGGKRFVVVVKNTVGSLDAFRELSIPKADRVDVFPAEKAGDEFAFFGSDGVHQKDKGFVAFPDKDLLMVDFTALEIGENLAQYKTEMKDRGKAYAELYTPNHPIRFFHLTSNFPIKWIGFMPVPDNVLDRMHTELVKLYGGPFQVRITITPVFNF